MRRTLMRLFHGKRVGVVAALLVAAALVLVLMQRAFGDTYAWSFTRPDRRYRVDVYRMPSLALLGSIGGGSDGPGYVVLRDAEGRALAEAPVQMLLLADRVYWDAREASMPFIGTWPLPD